MYKKTTSDEPENIILSLPKWTNYPRSNNKGMTKAFDTALGLLRPIGLVGIKDTLFMDLTKYAYDKNKVTILLKDLIDIFANSLKNTPPSQKINEITQFLELLAQEGFCEITYDPDKEKTIYSITLQERVDPTKKTTEDTMAPAREFIRNFYDQTDTRTVLRNQTTLPTLALIEEKTPTSQAAIQTFHSIRINDLNAAQSITKPFLQSTFDECEKAFIIIDFLPVQTTRAKNKDANPETVSPTIEFSLILNADQSLEKLINNFCIPVLRDFLKADDNSAIYLDIQKQWSSFLSANKIAETTEINTYLTQAKMNDRMFSYATYVLCEVMRKIKEQQAANNKYANIIRNPLIYQVTRLIYSYNLALRTQQTLAKAKIADRLKDIDLINEFLVFHTAQIPGGSGLVPAAATKEEIGQLLDNTKTKKLSEKHDSLKELIQTSPTAEKPVPPAHLVNGKYVSSWQLANVFLSLLDAEVFLLTKKLATMWANSSIPNKNTLLRITSEDLSPDFKETLELLYMWREQTRKPELFIKYFFPAQDAEKKYQYLRASRKNGVILKDPKAIVDVIDQILYASVRDLKPKDLVDLLNLTYADIATKAWSILEKRDGLVLCIIKRILASIGISIPNKKKSPPSPKKPSTNGTGSGNGSRPIAPHNPPKANPQAVLDRLAQKDPLAKNTAALNEEIDGLFEKWNNKVGPAKKDFRQQIDLLINKNISSSFSFGSITPEQGEATALTIIENNSILSSVPKNKWKHLARYIYLVALRFKLKNI